MTVLDARDVTARKPHVCEDCGRTIERGEQYRSVKSVRDYGIDVWKCCPQCMAFLRDLWEAEIRGEDEWGGECYAYLPEVDWHEVRSWSPLWALRHDLWRKQWPGLVYPIDPSEEPANA